MGYQVISHLQTANGLQLGLRITLGPSSPNIFNRDFGLGLRHSSPSFLLRSVTLRSWAFAVSPSPSCRTGVDPKSQIWSLRSGTFVEEASLGQRAHDRLVLCLRVLVPSHSYRRWLPQQASSSSVVHSSLHSSILVFSACIMLDSLDQPSVIA
jgi:hypothetical protein